MFVESTNRNANAAFVFDVGDVNGELKCQRSQCEKQNNQNSISSNANNTCSTFNVHRLSRTEWLSYSMKLDRVTRANGKDSISKQKRISSINCHIEI